MVDDYSPLKGKRILVTRSHEQSGQLSQLIKQHGATPVEIPLLYFERPEDVTAIKRELERFSSYQWVVFTSANGVRFFHEYKQQHRKDLPYPKVAVVGKKTMEVARELGLEIDLVPDEFVAESLAESLLRAIRPGENVLLARGNLSRPYLYEKLKAEGIPVFDLVVYETKRNDAVKEELKETMAVGSIDVLTFTSPSTVTYFFELMGGVEAITERPIVACIGPVAAKTAKKHGLSPQVVPAEYTAEGLVDALITYMENEKDSREEIR